MGHPVLGCSGTGKDGVNVKILWEDRLLYAVLALLVLAAFYDVYFVRYWRKSGAASRPGRSGAERKNPFTRLKC